MMLYNYIGGGHINTKLFCIFLLIEIFYYFDTLFKNIYVCNKKNIVVMLILIFVTFVMMKNLSKICCDIYKIHDDDDDNVNVDDE